MAWRLTNYVHGQLYLNLSVTVLKPTALWEPKNVLNRMEIFLSLAKTNSCTKNYAVFHNEVRGVW